MVIIISNDVLLTIIAFKVLASRVDVNGSVQFVGNNVAGIHYVHFSIMQACYHLMNGRM